MTFFRKKSSRLVVMALMLGLPLAAYASGVGGILRAFEEAVPGSEMDKLFRAAGKAIGYTGDQLAAGQHYYQALHVAARQAGVDMADVKAVEAWASRSGIASHLELNGVAKLSNSQMTETLQRLVKTEARYQTIGKEVFEAVDCNEGGFYGLGLNKVLRRVGTAAEGRIQSAAAKAKTVRDAQANMAIAFREAGINGASGDAVLRATSDSTQLAVLESQANVIRDLRKSKDGRAFISSVFNLYGFDPNKQVDLKKLMDSGMLDRHFMDRLDPAELKLRTEMMADFAKATDIERSPAGFQKFMKNRMLGDLDEKGFPKDPKNRLGKVVNAEGKEVGDYDDIRAAAFRRGQEEGCF
ncbi:MAG: hypothetical protein AB7P04_06665 [Bacteriovoracia bacterium]